MNLYPFQKEIILKIKKAISEGYKRILVQSSTGSGKTIMFSHIAQGAQRKEKLVQTVVHREEILRQTLKKYFAFGVKCGQIASGKPMTKEKIQVSMVGTLINRLNKVKKPDLLIFDEAHHSPANTWRKIIEHFYDTLLLGFTATPERMNGEGFSDIYQILIKGPPTLELVNDGYLTYPEMYRSPLVIEKEKEKITMGDYDKKQQMEKMSRRHIVGDVIDHYKQYGDGLPFLVSCVSIKHCYLMAETYNRYAQASGKEWKAVVVQGGSKYKKERNAGIEGLGNGSVQLVMFCDVISEGVDVPIVTGVQNLRKTLSLTLILQIWGRILRTVYADGYNLDTRQGRLQAIANGIKPVSIILDHAGNFDLHGHVLSARDWKLDHGKRNPRKEKPPTTTSCPKCYGVWPGELKICPGHLPDGTKCGYVFSEKSCMGAVRKTPEMIEGVLIKALPNDIGNDEIKNFTRFVFDINRLPKNVRLKAMIKKAYELQDLNKIKGLAAAVGYKPGWASKIWTDVLGNRR